MYLRRLELEEFRSYRRLAVDLDPAGLRVSGANATGKSTLLEAIMMLATTRSVRSTAERELINWESGKDLGFPPYARVRGTVAGDRGDVAVEITLQADSQGTGVARKQIKIGSRPRRAMDVVGTLRAVLFSPEDVALIAGSPGGRRRYLDLTLSQLDGAYLRALSRFGRVLTQRNGLLKALGRERVSAHSPVATSQLGYWDAELVALGAAIIARRMVNVTRLGELATDWFQRLTDQGEFVLEYRPSFPLDGVRAEESPALIDTVQATVARQYESHLVMARVDELRRGASLVGPHRDDLGFTLAGVDMGAYGSRGQQRLAVVALKLGEAALMTERGGEPPVLLLDDALSELDVRHRSLLTAAVAGSGGQVLLTGTEPSLLDAPGLARLGRAHLESGTLVIDG